MTFYARAPEKAGDACPGTDPGPAQGIPVRTRRCCHDAHPYAAQGQALSLLRVDPRLNKRLTLAPFGAFPPGRSRLQSSIRFRHLCAHRRSSSRLGALRDAQQRALPRPTYVTRSNGSTRSGMSFFRPSRLANVLCPRQCAGLAARHTTDQCLANLRSGEGC